MVKAVALLLVIRDVHGDGTTAEEHPHVAVLWKQRQRIFCEEYNLSFYNITTLNLLFLLDLNA